MKKIITLICAFVIVQSIKAQTTVYADSVLAFSSEYNTSTWSAQQIKGSPSVYPNCADVAGAWAFALSNQREWIDVFYNTPINVDSVYVYETNNSGTIDTLYLRNAQTQTWNIVYTATATPIASCNILKVGLPTTSSYLVDAVRITIADGYSPSVTYPEFDAIALVGTPAVGIKTHTSDKIVNVFPNPCSTSFLLNTKGRLNENIYVVDLLGNIVLKKTIRKEVEIISTEKLVNGMYFINFEDGSAKKIVLEK